MYIESLKLFNYRNINKAEVKFSNLNIIFGNNGQGKTNIIESIYLLYFLKSFRFSKNKNFVGGSNDKCSVIAKFKANNNKSNIKYIIDRNNKKFFRDDKEIKTFDFLKDLNVLLYYPGESNVITGSLTDRRNFIDRSIYQINHDYLKLIKEFNYILKSRNKVLKNRVGEFEYDLWTEMFIDISYKIINYRLKFIDLVNSKFDEISKLIFNAEYSVSLLSDNINIDKYKETLASKLEKNKKREFDYGYSLYGPQAQAIDFVIDGNECKYFCSQGELRIILLIYKFILRDLRKEAFGEFPVFLMDDFSSFIDTARVDLLINYVVSQQGQFILTDTCNVFAGRSFSYSSYEVNGGNITFN